MGADRFSDLNIPCFFIFDLYGKKIDQNKFFIVTWKKHWSHFPWEKNSIIKIQTSNQKFLSLNLFRLEIQSNDKKLRNSKWMIDAVQIHCGSVPDADKSNDSLSLTIPSYNMVDAPDYLILVTSIFFNMRQSVETEISHFPFILGRFSMSSKYDPYLRVLRIAQWKNWVEVVISIHSSFYHDDFWTFVVSVVFPTTRKVLLLFRFEFQCFWDILILMRRNIFDIIYYYDVSMISSLSPESLRE